MQVYVKETLYVLDYQDNIVGTIFNSNDHRSPGYAFNVSITEANTGYSDLKFEMPNIIINDKGDKIKNPLQALLTPLVKLRYHREVYYTGETPITVREPQGYGDTTVYIDKTYSNVYPDNIIEDYIMDYIVQPVDTKRDVLKTTTTFTAMDYPRFNLSKKRVGLSFSQDTLTKEEWSLFTNEPMDVPGKIKYIKWDNNLLSRIGTAQFRDVPLEWDPEHAIEYPLDKEHVEALMTHTAEWPYGYLATAFYWPITSTARFKGVMYNEGGYLVLHLYDFFNLTTEGIDPELHVDRYSWEWSQLYKVDNYLCPNNAKNYLYHILNGTNWSVALKEDGVTPDVDIVQTKVSNPKGSTTSFEWVDKTANVDVNNGNCYNAITAVCQALQLYPVFDCINRTVALHQFAGKNYGLVYALGKNIKEDTTKSDGEKVITKLYCTGGKDYNGDTNINIGEAERSSIHNLVGFYRQYGDLPQQDVDGQWAIVDSDLSVNAFKSTAYKIMEKYTVDKSSGLIAGTYYLRYDMSGEETYWQFTTTSTLAKDKIITYLPGDTKVTANGTSLTLTRVANKSTIDVNKVLDFNDVVLLPVETTVHDLSVKNYWVINNPDHRQVYFYNNGWHLGTRLESGLWQYGNIIVDPATGADYSQGEWNPNDDMYISCRSPYGTNYILNLRWAYQNHWITKEQILALYQYELQLHNLNVEFMDKYIEDYRLTRQLKNEAANNYDVAQDDYESTLLAMENTYNKNDKEPSEGKVHCFHKPPFDTYTGGDGLHYIKIGHCYECGHTNTIQNVNGGPGNDWAVCPNCGSKDIETNPIYIPVYTDFEPYGIDNSLYPHGTMVTNTYEGHNYNPKVKGYYERLVITLDRQSGTGEQETGWNIDQYEAIVPMTKTIDYKNGAVKDGYNYVLPDNTGHFVYVRSASGQIEVWNDAIRKYITRYGDMLSYHRKMVGYIHKIELLDQVYNDWAAIEDDINSSIQLAFGDYLIEGNYTNNEQPYVGLLFNEGLEASQKYSIPEITYTLNVIDSSGLIEYREPTVTRYRCAECDYVSYTPITICPRCANELIVTENDVYNDLVRLLHSVGQIVPKAGDYVTIYDEPMGMYGVPGLITQITRYPDNPMDNKIELNTSYTDDEELVGNIITATNTVLNNADIYARTAILKADGTIDSDSIKESLDNSGANISIVGTNGNILLDGSGLRATDPDADGHAIKYTGKGIFATTNLNPAEDEAINWVSLMTPNGVNASYISSGTIDTNKVSVIGGGGARVILDQYGLNIKKDLSKTSHIYPFDTSEAKTKVGYTNTWSTNTNLTSFIGVDQENQPLIYTQGFLVAEEGSKIGGWVTTNNALYHLSADNTTNLWLSTNGKNPITGGQGKVNNVAGDYAFYSNGKFGVTTGGILKAAGAVINGDSEFSGKITVTDSTSTMNTGTVGGFDSSSTGLTKNDTIVLSPSGYNGTVTINSSTSSNGPWAIYSKGNFGVTTGGILWAKGGKFGGQIEAESGHIGGWTIESGKLTATGDNNKVCVVQAPASNNTWVFAAGGTSHDNYSNCPFRVDKAGNLHATSATISGSISSSSITSSSMTCGSGFSVTSAGKITATSGSIGGWTIDGSNGFKSGNTHFNPNGNVEFYPQVGNGGNYIFNNGMTLHSTAAQTIKSGSSINFGNGETPNIYIKSTSAGDVEIHTANLRINATNMSVGNSYSGSRSNARTVTITVPSSGSITGQTLKFVNGILVE